MPLKDQVQADFSEEYFDAKAKAWQEEAAARAANGPSLDLFMGMVANPQNSSGGMVDPEMY